MRRSFSSRVPQPWSAVVPLLLLLAASACASTADAPPIVSSPGVTLPATATFVPVETPPAASATAAASATSSPAGPSVIVEHVGDVSLAREVVARMTFGGAAYPFALVAPLFRSDVRIANLEGALTERGEPWPKGYNFRTPPRFAAGLAGAGFGVVSVANNHTMDYGATGLLDTLAALDTAGVRHAGAGADDAAARAPVVIDTPAGRIAVLAYVATPDEGGGFSVRQWAAAPGVAGLALGTPDAIRADVLAAKRIADFVIVSVHAGDEYVNRPNGTQRLLAEAALSAGADVFVGHHAHVMQPIELRGRQLAAWGLGNFVFDLDRVDLANIPQPRVSMILRFTLTKGLGVTSYEAVPVALDIEEDRPRPATAAEADVLRVLVGGRLSGP